MTNQNQIARAVQFLEDHLTDGAQLADAARAAAVSRWHFHRSFVALTGETPASYVRRRKISLICERLLGTDQPLVDLALSFGFGSQASFTRAFTRHTGVSPGRYRKDRLQTPAYHYPPLDVAALVRRRQEENGMEPKIVEYPAFRVIGLAGRYDLETNVHIPSLWAQFAPSIDAIPGKAGAETFGVCCSEEHFGADQVARLVMGQELEPDPESPRFVYVAGVPVSADVMPPDGMVAVEVPKNRYAVFTHQGHLSGLRETVSHIWGEWLPAAPYRHVNAPDFELYDERLNVMTGEGELDIYVPIEG